MKSSSQLPTVLLKKVIHKNRIILLLLFPYNDPVIDQLRSLKTYTWSKSLRGWISSFSDEKVAEIQKVQHVNKTCLLKKCRYISFI